ncbi:MAG TPA: hypothetical protein DC009_06900, partial [Porphyromonadaceae bacterium]|nr:hypothetical protein [Porphyromonadaceae bacterium]
GSMDGYMCQGSELKDAVYAYISDLNSECSAVYLNYINSTVIPFASKDITSYIKTMNPQTFAMAGGNRNTTDISEVIKRVLTGMDQNTVAILVSDCILALPGGDSTKELGICKTSVKLAVEDCRKKIPDLGVEILKMESTFTGTYYQLTGNEQLANVKRPYYIWVFGRAGTLARLNREADYTALPGYKDMVAFTAPVLNAYRVSDKNDNTSGIHAKGENYELMISADMRQSLQPESVITDKSNYSFGNRDLEIVEIKPSSKDDKYSHIISFNKPERVRVPKETLKFTQPSLPEWIAATNEDKGMNIKANLSKTTGIGSIIGGVAEAYRKDKAVSTMKINITYN